MDRTTLPDWELAARQATPAADPAPLPVLCAVPWEATNVDCWKRLDLFDFTADANYQIAVSNTSALRKTEGAYDQIIEAGKLQQQLSQIRQDLLDQERRAHTMDTWFYRGFIALGFIAVAL